jgi:type I restriction enzyme M protein
VIELDGNRIRPFYLKAIFETKAGTKILSDIAEGTAIPFIKAEALKSILIPCPPLEEQIRLETQYIQNVESFLALEHQLTSVLQPFMNFFD